MNLVFENLIHSTTVLLFGVLLVWAAITDIRQFLIPNRISFVLVVLYPAHVFTNSMPVNWVGALITFGIVLAVGIALFIKKIMGGGDVKLMAVVSLWAGTAFIADFIFITMATGGILALIKIGITHLARFRSSEDAENSPQLIGTQYLPYGVAIACGGLFVMFQLLPELEHWF